MDAYLVHLSEVETFKVFQCQVWRQSESVAGERRAIYLYVLAMYLYINLQSALVTFELTWLYLFLISDSLRPSLGVSTVRAMALNPALSALLTSCSTTFLFLYT